METKTVSPRHNSKPEPPRQIDKDGLILVIIALGLGCTYPIGVGVIIYSRDVVCPLITLQFWSILALFWFIIFVLFRVYEELTKCDDGDGNGTSSTSSSAHVEDTRATTSTSKDVCNINGESSTHVDDTRLKASTSIDVPNVNTDSVELQVVSTATVSLPNRIQQVAITWPNGSGPVDVVILENNTVVVTQMT